MKEIKAIIEQLKSDWSYPKIAHHNGNPTSLPLICEFSPFSCFIPYEFPFDVPESLRTFWGITEKAHLFKDFTYGQWGLEIKSPYEAVHFTKKIIKDPECMVKGNELIFGHFLGDSDFLFISCADDETYGNITVALPMEYRDKWPVIATDFSDFLFNYLKFEGDMYWQYGKK
jgi:hypothetical protein